MNQQAICYQCGKSLKTNEALSKHIDNSTYFETNGVTFKATNGEFVESLHNSLRRHEETKKYVKKLGSAGHVKKSMGSISTFNTM